MNHGKVDVEHADQLRVALDGLLNALTSKRLLPEAGLDFVEHLDM